MFRWSPSIDFKKTFFFSLCIKISETWRKFIFLFVCRSVWVPILTITLERKDVEYAYLYQNDCISNADNSWDSIWLSSFWISDSKMQKTLWFEWLYRHKYAIYKKVYYLLLGWLNLESLPHFEKVFTSPSILYGMTKVQ